MRMSMAQAAMNVADIIVSKADTERPILHHLTADNSWFLQIPRPGGASHGRFFFNVLIDPWFTGPQTEMSSWLHRQSHTIRSAVQDIPELERLAGTVEELARELHGSAAPDKPSGSLIDAIALSFGGSDHVHQPTLTQVDPNVPVFATTVAAKRVKAFRHFKTVVVMPLFNGDWTSTRLPPLPDYVGISKIQQPNDYTDLHVGLLIAFDTHRRHGEERVEANAEALVYMPHGIPAGDLANIPSAAPRLSVLAMLHGLLQVDVGNRYLGHISANLGAHNGLKAQRLLKSRYWIGTHDEIKEKEGLTAWFLTEYHHTIEDALEKERRSTGEGEADRTGILNELKETNWLPLGNGQSKVLV